MVLRGDEQPDTRWFGAVALWLGRGEAVRERSSRSARRTGPAAVKTCSSGPARARTVEPPVEQLGEAVDRGLQHLLQVGGVAELGAQRGCRLAAGPSGVLTGHVLEGHDDVVRAVPDALDLAGC